MDLLLPVAPALGVYYPRHWRDIHKSEPIEITPPAYEPLSLNEAKRHLRMDSTTDDLWTQLAITTARRQVEADTNRTFVPTVFETVFDQYPLERMIPLPRSPLVSPLAAFTWVDLNTSVENNVDPTTFYLDTYSWPGRIILNTLNVWPTGVRWQNGGRVRWTAGFNGAAVAITSITFAAGVATVTTTAPHGFSAGQRVTVYGCDQPEYNGTFPIAVTGPSTFTMVVAGSPVTPATGASINAAAFKVPERYIWAMQLLLGHFDQNREALGNAGDVHPLGYEALVSDGYHAFG